MADSDRFPKQTDVNANEEEEIYNELSAGEEDPLDNPDTYNSGGTGSGVAPVSDITGHARGDTRPVLGQVPMGAEDFPRDSETEDKK